MNESMSILLATTILALGGLGLYMYKSPDNGDQKGGDEEYDEDGLFGTSSFFDWGKNDDSDGVNEMKNKKAIDVNDFEDKYENNDNDNYYDYKPRKRGGKTQRSRKTNGTSKRRY